MSYTLIAFQQNAINIAPKTTEEEILQNVATLISTAQYSIPLDRGLGLAQRFVDKPIQAAKAIIVSEVLDAVEKYEPRVEVVSVKFKQGTNPGSLIPVVEVNIIDEQ